MSNRLLSAKMEDYLETIFALEKENGVVRVKEISEHMEVRTPSVHSALHHLSDKGLLEHEHYGYIYLTPKGRNLAEKLEKKHCLLVDFFHNYLGVDEEKAEIDACRAEHVMSDDTLSRLEEFVKFLADEEEFIKSWQAYAR